ncbi:MAG: single-stranded DNA-binding protein [Oscillospiraceae bacterium]
MLNTVQLMGRIAQSPELFTTQNNNTLCRFSIAVPRDYKRDGEYPADFFRIVAWNKLAEFIEKHFSKGQLITLSGSLRTSTYLDTSDNTRTATEVVVDHIYFTTSKAENNKEGSPESECSSGLAGTDEYSELAKELSEIPDDYPY